MLYSFTCPTGSMLDVSPAGAVQCFDGSTYSAVQAATAVSLQPVGVDPQTSFTDGMTLGWGVASAVVAAWAIVHLRKGLIR